MILCSLFCAGKSRTQKLVVENMYILPGGNLPLAAGDLEWADYVTVKPEAKLCY